MESKSFAQFYQSGRSGVGSAASAVANEREMAGTAFNEAIPTTHVLDQA